MTARPRRSGASGRWGGDRLRDTHQSPPTRPTWPTRPRKRFGQHFLQAEWTAKLVASIAPQPDDVFLEIGPGHGALTLPLARRVRHVLAIEIDRDLAGSLRKRAPSNLTVVNADYLDTDLRVLMSRDLPPDRLRQGYGGQEGGSHVAAPIRVAGNLPYNVGSPMLLKLVREADEGRVLSDATLMLQKEVADRLLASPGTREYGVLSILTQLRADVQPVLALPPGAFRPVPRVSSSAVRLTFRPPAVTADERVFLLVVKTIFQQRRKTLLNAAKPLAAKVGVPAGEILARADIEARRRPETLNLAELARLSGVFLSTDI